MVADNLMKVLLINDREEGGGAEIVYRQTYKLLQSASAITSVRKSSPYAGPLSALVSLFGLFNFLYSIRLIWIMVTYRPDVVHIHNYIYNASPLTLLVLGVWKRTMGFCVIHTAHDFHLLCPNTGFIRYKTAGRLESCCRCVEDNRWTNVVKYNCDRRGIVVSMVRLVRHQVCYRWLHLERTMDRIICPSEFLATQIQRVYPDLNVVVLRNPAFVGETSMIMSKKDKAELNVLGYFGRLQPEKGIYQFIENDFDVSLYSTFLIYGDGPEEHKIKKLISNKGFDENIQLMGSVPYEEITLAMNSVDAVVLPSICHENCPLVVCDALKLGKKIVSSSPGGVAELLKMRKEGNMAFLDVETYQEELVAVYGDAVTSVRMAKSGL